MKLKLINKNTDNIRDVWKISRPMLSDNEIPNRNELISMNLPVSSFETYTIEVTSTILFRDLMLTFRPLIAAWAQSLRIKKFEYGELSLDEDSESQEASLYLNTCINRVKSGEIQDYVKEDLPWSTETTYVISLDFRTFQNIVFTLLEHQVKGCYKWYDFFKSSTGLTDKDFAKLNKADLYRLVSLTKEEKELPYGDSGGYMHALKANVLPNLMAQFIRMQTHTVKNGLWNLVLEHGVEAIECKRMSDTPVDVIAYLDDDSFKRIVSIRTCSFAQMDKESKGSWSSVLKPIVEKMSPQEFMMQLPCKGDKTKCRIQKDMEIKLSHKDENLPCAILLDNPYLIDNRINKFKSDSEVMKKWVSIKPLIKIDVNNKDNLEYHSDKYYPLED